MSSITSLHQRTAFMARLDKRLSEVLDLIHMKVRYISLIFIGLKKTTEFHKKILRTVLERWKGYLYQLSYYINGYRKRYIVVSTHTLTIS